MQPSNGTARATPPPRAVKLALGGSLVLHGLALFVLAAITLPTVFVAVGNSHRSQLVLELRESKKRAQPGGSAAVQQYVVIKPNVALIKGQRMVATASAKVPLRELAVTRTDVQLAPIVRSAQTETNDVPETRSLPQRAKVTTPADSVQRPSHSGKERITRKRRKRVFEVAGRAPAIPPDFSSSKPPYFNQPPVYPSIAVQRGYTGKVLLKLWVAETGRVVKVAVAKSSGYAVLDAAAVNALKTWLGKPAMKNGRTIATVCTMPVEFAR